MVTILLCLVLIALVLSLAAAVGNDNGRPYMWAAVFLLALANFIHLAMESALFK